MTTTLNAATAGAGGFIASSDNSGVLALQTSGTTAVSIDTSQNVGIGNTTPSSYNSNANKLVIGSNSAVTGMTLASGTTAAGNIFFARGTTGADAYDGYVQYVQNGQYMAFGTSGGTERMRIDSSGSLCIGNSGNFGAKVNITFDPASTNGLLFAVSSGTFTNKYIYFQNSGGSQIGSVSSNNASVTYNTTSDYRIKTNIQPISGALAKVIQLKPVIYDWKPEFAEGSSQGFIAHELQAIVPDCVTGSKDAVDADGKPVYQGIDTSFLVATLTAALQETKALIDTQAETINALTARVVALEGK